MRSGAIGVALGERGSAYNLVHYQNALEVNSAGFPWAPVNVKILPGITADPFGLLTGNKIFESVDSNFHQTAHNSIYIGAAQTYRFSMLAKEAEKRYIQCYFRTGAIWGGGNPVVVWDLNVGSVTQQLGNAFNASIYVQSNGWWRCSFEAISSLTGFGGFTIVLCNSPSTAVAYTGNGSDGLYVTDVRFGLS